MIMDEAFWYIESETFAAEKRDHELLKEYVNAL